MSVNYEASLIVGLPLEDVYWTESNIECVKQYDVNTGEPYLVDRKVYQTYWKGKAVEDGRSAEQLAQAVGLKLYRPNSYTEDHFIGLEVNRTDDNTNVDLENIVRAMDKIRDALEMEPEIFLSLEVH